MNKLASYVFSRIPHLEIGVRVAYWRSERIHKYLQKFKQSPSSSKNRVLSGDVSQRKSVITLGDLEKEIRSHSIKEGDILIVHSSMQRLSCTGASPSEIIKLLLRIVGDTGTLVMPAIPKYKEAEVVASGIARVTADVSSEVWTYDVKKTPPWTGILPLKLMNTEGARRGRHPLNTVVAKGYHVNEMFGKELQTPMSTPCGPDSPWAYCAEHNAKVLALGVDLAHSLTMIHVAEDCYESTWPIKNWYRHRSFQVIDDDKQETVVVRERHPKWAMHYCERKLDYDLERNNVSRKTMIGDIDITSVDSKNLLNYLNGKKRTGYPYYLSWIQ